MIDSNSEFNLMSVHQDLHHKKYYYQFNFPFPNIQTQIHYWIHQTDYQFIVFIGTSVVFYQYFHVMPHAFYFYSLVSFSFSACWNWFEYTFIDSID